MDRLVGALEAVLFASGEPVSHGALLEILQIDGPRLEQLLDNYRQELLERHSGLQLQQIAGGWQLATNMDYYDYVQRLGEERDKHLSQAAMPGWPLRRRQIVSRRWSRFRPGMWW